LLENSLAHSAAAFHSCIELQLRLAELSVGGYLTLAQLDTARCFFFQRLAECAHRAHILDGFAALNLAAATLVATFNNSLPCAASRKWLIAQVRRTPYVVDQHQCVISLWRIVVVLTIDGAVQLVTV
jgi:hypothetical protein